LPDVMVAVAVTVAVVTGVDGVLAAVRVTIKVCFQD
jgi:hypothetical protein